MDFTRRSSIMILVWIADFVSKYVLSDILSPFISHSVSRHYVAQVADKMVLQYSSSGGVAYELGRWAIRNGYKVVGTTYDMEQDRAVWKIADKESELSLFSGSKYIQSIPSGIISQFNKQDKYLVVGTPCQIAGLVKYIETKRFDRNKFLLVDFHCHGVPSYIVWDKYVEYVKKRMDVKISPMFNFAANRSDGTDFF